MTNDELLIEIEIQQGLMVAVATGKTRIEDANDEYKQRRHRIQNGLIERKINEPNPHADLWRWYGKWRKDLPNYQSRRDYVAELYEPIIEGIRQGRTLAGTELFDDPTGWERVDRGLEKIKRELAVASNEEEFQSIGLLCREALISVAQATYNPQIHTSTDGTKPSETDAKRMLDAYFAKELVGGSNEAARRHAKAALDLANDLQHRRTATFRDAALCSQATSTIVNLVAIISGRRNTPITV